MRRNDIKNKNEAKVAELIEKSPSTSKGGGEKERRNKKKLINK